MKKELTPVQQVSWDIMKFVKQYIIKKDLKYFLLGGTLLGAVRHQGFIPWDDDIDIGLPRKDYEFLLNDIKSYLPPYLELRTFNNDKSHHYYFARIVDTRFDVKRTGSEIERVENVWIDIFPLDGMPNNFLMRRVHMMHLLFTRMMYHIATFDRVNLKRPNRPVYEKIIIKFVEATGYGKRKNANVYLKKIDKLLMKYPVEKSNWIINFMGQYIFKEMFNKKIYGQGALYPFENDFLVGPDNADFVLSQMYGDYMKVPDNKDKNTHAVSGFSKEG